MDRIVTSRLILRTLASSDSSDMFDYAKLDTVGPNAGWQPHKDEQETLKTIEWMIKSEEIWAIVLKDTQKVIGSIGLHKREHKPNEQEIGYVLNPHYWHNGYMQEAVKALIIYSFEHLDLEKLHCAHFDGNIASQKVIERTGFQKVGQSKTTINLYGFQIEKVSLQYELSKASYERKQLPWQQH